MLTALTLAPFLIVGVGALLLMLVEVTSKSRSGLALGATIILAMGGVSAIALWWYGTENLDAQALAPWLITDKFALFFDGLVCLGGALAALLAGGYLPEHNLDRGEFYSLLLFATFGAMMLAGAGDLLVLFLGLETMSIGAYAMTAFRRAALGRGRPEVLPPRVVRRGHHALRFRAPLRRDGSHRPRRPRRRDQEPR